MWCLRQQPTCRRFFALKPSEPEIKKLLDALKTQIQRQDVVVYDNPIRPRFFTMMYASAALQLVFWCVPSLIFYTVSRAHLGNLAYTFMKKKDPETGELTEAPLSYRLGTAISLTGCGVIIGGLLVFYGSRYVTRMKILKGGQFAQFELRKPWPLNRFSSSTVDRRLGDLKTREQLYTGNGESGHALGRRRNFYLGSRSTLGFILDRGEDIQGNGYFKLDPQVFDYLFYRK